MQTLRGIAVSPGVAIGKAVVLDAADRPVPMRQIPEEDVPVELERLEQALSASSRELAELRERTADLLGDKVADIFAFHIGMLSDKQLTGQIRAAIKGKRSTAEHAVYRTLQDLIEAFQGHRESLFRERGTDLIDLQRRVLRHLIGERRAGLTEPGQSSIIIAHDLTPSQTAGLRPDTTRALAIDGGGRTSHTAILAHALGIPAIVGLGDASRNITSGQTVIIDGNRGLVIDDPDGATLLEYRQEQSRAKERVALNKKLRELPSVTKDGESVSLLGNIEFPEEIPGAIELGAEGVGLYRTEFLFLAQETLPNEEEQLEVYTRAVQAMQGRPLTFRTIDFGADKIPSALPGLDTHERNPFLGCRSIRLCLQNLPLFKTQLRAILRASVHGPVRMMFPLISNIMELRQAKMVLNDVREDLEDQDIPFAEDLPVGIMIEVPSAALQAHALVKEVDFVSIGTNDLIQYTVAVDRGNERIANLYSAAHPALIHLLKEVIRAANRAEIGVSLCGEMAGDPEFTMLLLGLGLRSFSVTPPAIPEIKRVIREVSIAQCRRVSRKAASLDTQQEIQHVLRDEMLKHVDGFDQLGPLSGRLG